MKISQDKAMEMNPVSGKCKSGSDCSYYCKGKDNADEISCCSSGEGVKGKGEEITKGVFGRDKS